MCDDKGGTVSGEMFQGVLYHLFTLIVERGSRLIENEDGWIFQENSGDGEPLFLSPGQFDAPLPDVCVVAVGER